MKSISNNTNEFSENELAISTLEMQKARLEIIKLKHETSIFGYWLRRISAFAAVIAALTVVFTGIQQYSRNLDENIEKRKKQEMENVSNLIEGILTGKPKAVALASIRLSPIVKNGDKGKAILNSLGAAISGAPTPKYNEKELDSIRQRVEAELHSKVKLRKEVNDANKKRKNNLEGLASSLELRVDSEKRKLRRKTDLEWFNAIQPLVVSFKEKNDQDYLYRAIS